MWTRMLHAIACGHGAGGDQFRKWSGPGLCPEQFPYDVLGIKEKDFHLALHAFFVSSGFETESEEHSLNGRADLVVKAGSVVYIIELKVDMGAECALSQIEEQGYYKKHLLHASAKNLEIHLMGLSISSKSRNIVDYREKLITGGV